MSNKQLPADNWVRDGRQWSEYPEGTKAKALMGGYWIKLKCGRWQWPGGCSFPTPGGDATGEVCLPFIDTYNKIKDFMTAEERIKAGAEAATRDLYQKEMCSPNELKDYRRGYIAGATAGNNQAQVLVDALENAKKHIHDLCMTIIRLGYTPFNPIIEINEALQQWKGKEVDKPGITEEQAMALLSQPNDNTPKGMQLPPCDPFQNY